MYFHRTAQPSRHGAVCAGAHFATIVLSHQELQNRPFLIAAANMEIAELAQREVTGSCSAECTCSFRVCLIHAAHPWTCFVVTLLIPLLRDAVKQFSNPSVLSYCKIRDIHVEEMLATPLCCTMLCSSTLRHLCCRS